MSPITTVIFTLSGLFFSASSLATMYTSESLFQADAAGANLETFDSFSEGTAFGDLTSLGISFFDQGDGLPEIFSYASSSGATPKSQPNNLGNRPFGDLSTQSYIFSAINGDLITAVGLWNIGTDDNMILEFFDDQNSLLESHTINQGPAIFGGIINSLGAAKVVIRHGGAGNGFMGIDDLQVGFMPSSSPPSIPEPPALGIYLLGFAALYAKKHMTRSGGKNVSL